jgi:4-amino-4-deoxy-L-arabinose transferase-like glycosyltransferase
MEQPVTRNESAAQRLTPPVLLGLAAALVAAAVLRLRGLGDASLWSDELVAWWAASGESLGDVVSRATTCMATPPLSFLVQHMSVGAAGASEWALRLPSALAGIAAVALAFAAGRRLFGHAAGLAAAFLLAVHPVHLWFSTDARPYSLAVLLALGSTWALSEMVRSQGRWTAVATYAVLTAGLLHAQFIFVPFVVAQVVALLLMPRSGVPALPARRLAVALGGMALLALPLAPQLLSVAGRASSLTWPFRGTIPPGLFAFFQTTPLAVGALLTGVAWLVAGRRGGDPPETMAPQRRADLLALSLGYVVPAALLSLTALTLDLPTLLKPRYLVASLAPCVLLVGWLVTSFSWRPGRWILTLTYLALVFGGDVGTLRRGETFNVNARNENWGAAAQVVKQGLQPGDLVLLRSGLVETDAYFQGAFPEMCRGYLETPLGDFYLPSRPETVLLPHAFDAGAHPDAYQDRIGRHLAGRRRIWFVMLNPASPSDYYRQVARYVTDAGGRSYRLGGTGDFVYLGQVTLALLEAVD